MLIDAHQRKAQISLARIARGLRSAPPYEEYEKELLPARLAERSAEFKLYLAKYADQEGIPAAALGALAEPAARGILKKLQMSDIRDWRSLLSAYAALDSKAIEPGIGKVTGLFVSMAVLAPAGAVSAQDTPVFKVETRLVEVYATVRDNRGRYLDGLTQDRFQVLDNGVPQTVTAFESNSARLTCALLIDTTGSMASVLPVVKNSVKNLIDEPARRGSGGGVQLQYAADPAAGFYRGTKPPPSRRTRRYLDLVRAGQPVLAIDPARCPTGPWPGEVNSQGSRRLPWRRCRSLALRPVRPRIVTYGRESARTETYRAHPGGANRSIGSQTDLRSGACQVRRDRWPRPGRWSGAAGRAGGLRGPVRGPSRWP